VDLKKLGASIVLASIALSIPFTSAFAASGWQYIGDGNVIIWSSTLGKYKTPTFNSGGGYIKICVNIPGHNETTADFTLYEYDESNADEKIEYTTYLSDGLCTTFYVDNYVDGDNNKAELYVASKYKGTIVSFYD
jgi:hypothetical protein